jgi:hypothetical protein
LEALEDRLVLSLSSGSSLLTGVLGGGAAQSAQPIATTTVVTSSANPGGFSQVVAFTATISAQKNLSGATPTGTVQFLFDGANFGDPVKVSTTKGVTTATYNSLLSFPGAHTLTASYSGDGSFAASSGSLTQMVNLRSTSAAALTSSLNPSTIGQSVTFLATVRGLGPSAALPTGTMLFVIDGNQVASVALTTTKSGVSTASYSTAALSGGHHNVLAVYSGDINFNGSLGVLVGFQHVNRAGTKTTVSSSSNPAAPGQSVTFTASLSVPTSLPIAPTGSIAFIVDGITASTAALVATGNGGYKAAYTASPLSAGTHTVIASYSGDASFTGSSGTLAGGQVVGSGTPIPGGGGGTGSGGNVIVTFNPSTGFLNIIGYNDNDALTISQGSAGMIQVAGNGTLLNQSTNPVSYAAVTAIQITLLNGNDSLAINNLSIPGNLSIYVGSGSDNVSLESITAGFIRLSVAGPGNSDVSLNSTAAGTIDVAAGNNATLALNGVSTTGPVLLTTGTNASVSVGGLNAAGDLDITAGNNAQSITVNNSSVNNLDILQSGTTGSPAFDLETDTINSILRMTTGGSNNSLVLSQLGGSLRMSVALGAGENTVNADHVTALFGTLDGGSSGKNTYNDGGGNSGFSVFDFTGR